MFEPEKVEMVKPANSLSEFRDRLAVAKANLIKSMVVTKELMSQLIKSHNLPEAGYIIYENVFVYEEGREEEAVKRDQRTIEDILFGQTKVGIDPATTVQSVARPNVQR